MMKRLLYLVLVAAFLQVFGGVASAARPVQPYYTTRDAEVPAAGLEVNTTNAGMVIWATAISYAIVCERGSGTGTLEQRGKATSTITYEECRIREVARPGARWELGRVETGCKVKSRGQAEGKIALGTLNSEIVWQESVNMILNLVKPAGTNFAEIEISTGAGERCEPGGANRTGTLALSGDYLPTFGAVVNGEAPFMNEEASANLTVTPAVALYSRWEVEPRGGRLTSGVAALSLGGAPVAIEQTNTIRPKPRLSGCANVGIHE